MKKTIITIIVIIVLGIGAYLVFQSLPSNNATSNSDITNVNESEDNQQSEQDSEDEEQNQEANQEQEASSVIGHSAEGRDITAYNYGSGDTEILLIGGIHGGYSWNTSLVAYEAMNYLESNPDVVPDNVKVTIVPVLNPDGLSQVVDTEGQFSRSDVVGSQEERVEGRFNANGVDLNRNFDCDWQADAKWQDRDVDGGSEPFSEPESLAIRNYIDQSSPDAVVVWYSAAGGVFASSCHNGVLSETSELTSLYADASDYDAYESFDFYATTGDMVNWLAKEGIPAISVLLSNHEDVEWTKNREGIEALLNHYAD